MTVAEWAFEHGEMAGAGTQTLANAKICFMPMKSQDEVVGLIGIEFEFKGLLIDQRRLLGAIATLSALGAIRWVRA
jgi:two-component system sensor histidine kinase KdpD